MTEKKAADKSAAQDTADKDEAKAEETPNSEVEAGENWPDGASDAVKAYEELRANPPEDQEGLTPKPE
jgi:hypothetical protein